MVHLSVVIPVYNESSLIDELVKRVKTNVNLITEDYEIIIVDDGSQDNTWNSIENETKSEEKIKGIKLSKNFGHHYAITAGLHNAIGEWVVVMDGDLQDRPEVISDLYNKAISGYDVVFVSRQNRPEKLYYRIAQKVFYITLNLLSGLNFNSRQANFSIVNSKVVQAFQSIPEHSRFYGSTVKWLGFKRTEILADHGQRFSGRPSYTFRKRIKLAAEIIISFSDRPSKILIMLGMILTVIYSIGTIYICYIIIFTNKINVIKPIVFFSSMFFMSVSLLFLTHLSLYIFKINNEVKTRPLYIIEKIV